MVYDLERTFVLPVPPPLRRSLVASLDRPFDDHDVQRWLMEEELLTVEARPDWSDRSRRLPEVTDVSFDMSGACNLGCVYCFEKDIQSRIGPMSEETAMAALDFAFRKAGASPGVVLHFGSGEPLLSFALLRKIVAEAERRAAAAGQTLSYELTTNATLVTGEIARFLAEHPFRIRVSCDGPAAIHDRYRPKAGGQPSYDAVVHGLGVLLEHLADRVTVNSVLASGTRLAELWAWAKTLGIRHYHVIKVGTYKGDALDLHEAELREFRRDLQGICDDLFAAVEAGQEPIDYQPITKVIRRLMIPQPVTRFCGVAGTYLGVASNGGVYPCFRHLGVERYRLGDIWQGVDDRRRAEFRANEAADVDHRPVCQTCWARYLCGGGCYADSTVYGPDPRQPQVQHCPFWRTEIELAIRLYQRMLDADPSYCLAMFHDDPGED